ncbi:hypothetical protein [Sphingomonas sp. BK235]|uniref:hypothetical protein n=1 Tax=Sphingomonas sp. BK235 TaxID=2512131 RepID=UPI00104A95CE|nr:hypothetical protein [Sphingomonas sp. BK235]TCP35868.1 hypothetical protein EV292_102457 [Sphingomonas sp. BK235]
MTSEVAILNKSGIAVAADSAVTIGGARVWMSTNKIFSLGPSHDLAIMIYGSGDFMGFPWELIIRSFREYISQQPINKLEQCISLFLDYLSGDKWHDQDYENLSNAHIIVSRIEYVLEGLEWEDESEFRSVVKAEAERLIDQVRENEVVMPTLTLGQFRTQFLKLIEKFCEEMLDFKAEKSTIDLVTKYIYEFYKRKDCSSGYETGVVFLGFGADELFPSVKELIVDGKLNKKIRHWRWRSQDLNIQKNQDSGIMSFAQMDMTTLFMDGISRQYVEFFFKFIDGILEQKADEYLKIFGSSDDEKIVEKVLQKRKNEKIMEELIRAYKGLQQVEIVNPVTTSLRALPRDEMTAMAEAFVELTSMRRKVDSNLQTVGGPVDVAFISKSDGLIWVKRKLYFEENGNGDFFERRRRKLGKQLESKVGKNAN